MDRAEILERFDREMRQDPPLDPGQVVERSHRIVRVIGEQSWICFSRLTDSEAPGAVEREAARFRGQGGPVEWKLYDHDGPSSLPKLLEASGFVPDPSETLMVLDLDEHRDLGLAPFEVVVRPIEDPAGLETAVRVSRTAFAPDPGWTLVDCLPRLGTPGFAVFVASVDGRPVSAGRIDLPHGKSFASLWGGGTLPEYRGRGVYRALVAARAEVARARGYRYLTVDALETSRPILQRVGFQPLDRVVGWVLDPGRVRSGD